MKYILLTFMVCLLVSCGDNISETGNPDELVDLAEFRQEISRHLTNELILPAYQELSSKSDLLQEAAATFAENPDQTNLDNLKAAHQASWISWQKTSLYYLGPTVNNGLRAGLNTYPADVDKIENNIATGSYQLGSLANQDAEGLPALDYLLNGMDELAPLADFTA